MSLSAKSLTLTLGLGLAVAAAMTSPAAPVTVGHAPKFTAAIMSRAKGVITSKGCNTCHGADLAGKPHFAPSLHASGVLREYNVTTFARVMDTGVTNDGGHVRPPMPVYHLKTADSVPLYGYLKTLK